MLPSRLANSMELAYQQAACRSSFRGMAVAVQADILAGQG